MKRIYYVLAILLAVVLIDFSISQHAHAQTSSDIAAVQVTVAPLLSATPAPNVAVPEPAAPPQWATDMLLTISKLPMVGPYVSKMLLYLGILSALLTTLAAAAMSILASLKGVLNSAGLDKLAAAIDAFQKGKVMYWITYFSNFNAQKPKV